MKGRVLEFGIFYNYHGYPKIGHVWRREGTKPERIEDVRSRNSHDVRRGV